MPDLLGPANAPFSVTVRPADTRVFGVNDTYFKDCTSPTTDDGTDIQAAFLNGLLQQVRRAIRGSGVTESNADDDMLLKAITALVRQNGAPGRNIQIFTASGTFTVPADVKQIFVELWGGGGGGGASAAGGGASGGGSGGYAQKRITVTPGQSYAVTVGTGGTGGVASPAANATAGGTSSFGGVVSAVGGAAGVGANSGQAANSVSGGTATGGDLNINGAPSNGGIVGGSSTYYGGSGGSAPRGGPGAGIGTSAGNPGTSPGGGGAGSGQSGGNGGAGGAGLVIVSW